MPFKDNGDGTFRIDPAGWGGGGPDAIIRQADERYHFSPQQRQEMEEPGRIHMTPQRVIPPGEETTYYANRPFWMGNDTDIYGAVGQYGGGKPRVEDKPNVMLATPLNNMLWREPEDVLAHEWAHKYYYEDLPWSDRAVFNAMGPSYVGRDLYDQARRHYTWPEVPGRNEVYAQIAAEPNLLARMDPGKRQALYPYLDQQTWDQRHKDWANSGPSEATGMNQVRQAQEQQYYDDYARRNAPSTGVDQLRGAMEKWRAENDYDRIRPGHFPYAPLHPEWRQFWYNPAPYPRGDY